MLDRDLQRRPLCRRAYNRQSQRDERVLPDARGHWAAFLLQGRGDCARLRCRPEPQKESEARDQVHPSPSSQADGLRHHWFLRDNEGEAVRPFEAGQIFRRPAKPAHPRGAGWQVRSLTITPESLSFCYSEDVEPNAVKRVYGVDRNEKNLTFGDRERVTHVDMAGVVKIRQTTREVVGSFKRNDARIRRKLARKYWRRANHRTDQMLHAAANYVVDDAEKNRAALAVEDLTGIRRLYRRGNGQGADYRFRLNSWPHRRAKRMLEYKAAWKGVTVIQLTKSETYRSSSTCSTCGERLRNPAKGDAEHGRMLWCQRCEGWIDRDVCAALNLSTRGRSRLDRSLSRPEVGNEGRSQQATASLPSVGKKGLAGEAVTGNGTTTLILRVDASKLIRRREPKS